MWWYVFLISMLFVYAMLVILGQWYDARSRKARIERLRHAPLQNLRAIYRRDTREADRIVRQIQRLLSQWEQEREEELGELLNHYHPAPPRKPIGKVNWKQEGF